MRDHRGFDDGDREVPTRGRDWRCALFVSKNTNAEIDIRRGWISAELSDRSKNWIWRQQGKGSKHGGSSRWYFGEEMAQLAAVNSPSKILEY